MVVVAVANLTNARQDPRGGQMPAVRYAAKNTMVVAIFVLFDSSAAQETKERKKQTTWLVKAEGARQVPLV